MANIKVQWSKTNLISISDVARNLGFDLRHYDLHPEEVRAFMRKSTIDHVIEQARQCWRDDFDGNPAYDRDFNRVKTGVYVISVGDGFGVKYCEGVSEVMYIGRGVIANRLRSHLVNWIFDMSRSLRDVSFRFYMERIGDGRTPHAFKDFEHHLLEQFSNKFGEKPLINKIHGRAGRIDHTYGGDWNAPLDNRGKAYQWEIRPTPRNAWFKEFTDD